MVAAIFILLLLAILVATDGAAPSRHSDAGQTPHGSTDKTDLAPKSGAQPPSSSK